MAIAVVATRNGMATYYGATYAGYFGLATADPGTSATPSSEVSGGSPAYARKAITWGTAASSTITATSVTFDSPAATITHVFAATASTGNVMTDKAAVTSVVLSTQGQVVVTGSYVQS